VSPSLLSLLQLCLYFQYTPVGGRRLIAKHTQSDYFKPVFVATANRTTCCVIKCGQLAIYSIKVVPKETVCIVGGMGYGNVDPE
jgi:hypothetical protein